MYSLLLFFYLYCEHVPEEVSRRFQRASKDHGGHDTLMLLLPAALLALEARASGLWRYLKVHG